MQLYGLVCFIDESIRLFQTHSCSKDTLKAGMVPKAISLRAKRKDKTASCFSFSSSKEHAYFRMHSLILSLSVPVSTWHNGCALEVSNSCA